MISLISSFVSCDGLYCLFIIYHDHYFQINPQNLTYIQARSDMYIPTGS